jgi:diguanylate cyclase (GGDEF)-like protein
MARRQPSGRRDPQHAAPLPEEDRREPQGNLVVALVEDNPDHALLAREALEERGHQVVHYQRALAALAGVRGGGLDAIVLDYRLPDMSGLDALAQLLGLPDPPPVVMITAGGSEAVAVAALKRGARDYVIKSGSHGAELARAVELAVAKHRMEKVVALHRRELERRANTDAVTGLFNRHRLDDELSVAALRAVQRNEPYAVAVVDIDHFKHINDTRGHDVGDAVLVEFATVLRACVRSADVLARYGGDEFVIIMPGASATVRARFRQRLRRALRDSALARKMSFPLSASVGMADWSVGGPDEVLKAADHEMYASKRRVRRHKPSRARLAD